MNITAWKCPACGAVLTTQGGVKRHQERCKEAEDGIKGQIDMIELLMINESSTKEAT